MCAPVIHGTGFIPHPSKPSVLPPSPPGRLNRSPPSALQTAPFTQGSLALREGKKQHKYQKFLIFGIDKGALNRYNI